MRSVTRPILRPIVAQGELGGRGRVNAILPLDVEGGPSVAAAFGVKPLRKAWADGPLFELHNFDNPASPITWSAKGLEADIEALAAILEVDPVTGIGGALINIAYDQSGQSRNFTQSGDILQKPDLWLIRGKVYYFGGGFLSVVNGNTGGNYLNVDAGVSLDMHNHAVFALHKPYSSTNANAATGGHQSDIFVPGGGSNGFWWWSSSENSPDAMSTGLVDTVAFDTWGAPITAPILSISKQVQAIVAKPTDAVMWFNEHSASKGTPLPQGGAPATGGTIGKFPYGDQDFYGGRMEALIIYDEAPSDAVATRIRQSLYNLGQIADQTNNASRVNVLVTGASLDQGQGGDATGAYDFQHNGGGYGWVEIIADRHAREPIIWHNIAASGSTTEDDLANYNGNGKWCIDPGARLNIAIVGNSAVGNDEFQGHTGATAYAKFVDTVNAAKADGWDRVATYLFDTTGDAPGTTAYDYNVLVQANAAALGITLLSTSVEVTPEGNNATGHFNVLGYTQMADQIEPGLMALLA
ncbi:hypothetical protein [Bradyrhizobium sp. I71]|uniref:SGNH/GDSL hydrolase family protein n=1 Tax=Bradyrhizobium sp. I71 TaxID=2590772 RepID=UPI001EF7FFFF|nr:hypothetical protein [Bradyrhizobium sp. I71]ULK98847.1 hypothetical protein FJV43_03630 [Bradyrhizobium sp. I71]